MEAPRALWIVRLAWLGLPFLAWAGPAAALSDASTASKVTVAGAGWVLWAAALVASALARPWALVAVRLLMPLAPAATAVGLLLAAGDGAAAAGDGDTIRGVIGFSAGVAAAALVMLPSVGAFFLDGDSYGDERRFGLRCPGALVIVLGPLWLLGVGLPAVGLVLCAAQRWALGVPALLVGGLAALWLWAVAARLARRFAVFVPAGLTLVDPLSLADPVLFARNRTLSVEPASAAEPVASGGQRVDLSGAALGLAVELRTDGPTEIVTLSRPEERGNAATGSDDGGLAARLKSARMGVPRQADSVLFTPSRPAEFLLEARRTGLGRG
ncbi:MAG: hypothetical protein R2704_06195 [Microthrixaceae bacterium]